MKKIFFAFVLTLLTGAVCVCLSQNVMAGAIPDPGSDTITQIDVTCSGGVVTTNCYNDSFLKNFSNKFFNFFGYIAALGVVMIIVAGIRYSLARGDTKKIATAKTMIFQSMLAIGLLVAAYAIVTLLWSLASTVSKSASNGNDINLPTKINTETKK